MTISGDYAILNGGIRHSHLTNICQLPNLIVMRKPIILDSHLSHLRTDMR